MTYPFRTDPYIIAEVGSCHDGNLTMAKVIIEAVAKSGADAVKFQLYDSYRLAVRRKAEKYQSNYVRYQLPHHWLPEIKKTAREFGLDLVLSVYDQFDLRAAHPHADLLKISSFESSDTELIKACRETGKPVIVSTGLTTDIEISTMNRTFLGMFSQGSNIFFLHCVSAYPTAMKDLNLTNIRTRDLDGFSDHSRNTLTGALAVSHGAKILEVHVRAYSTKAESPDWPHSLDPGQLFEYVRNAQQAKLAIGKDRTGILPCEEMLAGFKVKPQ